MFRGLCILFQDHWIFCSDKDIVFSRIAEQKLFSDYFFPADKTVVSCDLTCEDKSVLWNLGADAIAETCILDLEKLNIINRGDVAEYKIVKIPQCYPLYSVGYDKKIEALIAKLCEIENIICTGRLGLCNYSNIDHCVDMSVFLAKSLSEGKTASCINRSLFKRTQAYRIID